MPTVLIADKMNSRAQEVMASAGLDVIVETGLTEDQLCEKAGQVDGIIVRSASKITPKILQAGSGKLQIIGRAGVGVDNIDLAAATETGVIVENTPFGNIISAAEHALALLMALARNIPPAHVKMADGVWDKKSFTGVELDGKTMGIVGMGKVGAIVARVTRALNMKVLVFDPYLTERRAAEQQVEKVELDDLFARADFISLHTPLTDKTRNMIDAAAFAKMKKGVRLVNAARGGIVDEGALIDALQSGQVAGAALDVFSEEPYKNGPLCRAKNIILTPHLGASTVEAQAKVAEQIAEQFVAFFNEGRIINAVNLSVSLDPGLTPFADLATDMGRMLGQLTDGAIDELQVSCYGKIAEKNTRQIALFAMKGLMSVAVDNPVTLVNAEQIAQNRGLKLLEQSSTERRNFVSVITVTAKTPTGESSVSGTLFENHIRRIVNVNGFPVDFSPADNLLVIEYEDKPGMVGRIGTILGDADVNIADMVVGREKKGETAVVVLTLDDKIDEPTMKQIADAISPRWLKTIRL